MRIRPVGTRALLIEVNDPLTWHAELLRRRAAGDLQALDLVPGAGTVLLDGVADPDRLTERLSSWRLDPEADADSDPDRAESHPPNLITIDVRYDGPDLPDVANAWGCSPEAAVAHLTGTRFRVAFCGFAPGFGYLSGLPASLTVPRRAEPRSRVPAGSVGLADGYAGIYPSASPGGWQLVGRTEATLFDGSADPPALLTPGTDVYLLALWTAGQPR